MPGRRFHSLPLMACTHLPGTLWHVLTSFHALSGSQASFVARAGASFPVGSGSLLLAWLGYAPIFCSQHRRPLAGSPCSLSRPKFLGPAGLAWRMLGRGSLGLAPAPHLGAISPPFAASPQVPPCRRGLLKISRGRYWGRGRRDFWQLCTGDLTIFITFVLESE